MFLEAKQLKKSYRLGEVEIPALRGLNFSLAKGDFATLIGRSGSGKSTLLNIVGTLDKPDQGSLVIDGREVTTLSEAEGSQFRSRKIGFIFQSFNLIPVLSVFENVELPLLLHKDISVRERRDRVLAGLKDVELESFATQMPDRLSGGQRQRVAIARALVTQPELILADEPTANLDSDTAHRILDVMQNINDRRKVTFLFSTHDEKLIGRVKRVLQIRDGLIE